ncbi:hypothetical protein ACFLSJ_04385 [Verrucomicrobiota bacterium]
MARKNRKKTKHGVAIPSPVAGIAIVVGTLALTCIWFQGRCDSLARQKKTLEEEHEILKKRYWKEECKWMQLKARPSLDQALRRHGLCLRSPEPDQIVQVSRADMYGERDSGDTMKYASLGNARTARHE